MMDLFVPGSASNVDGNNTPTDFTDGILLTPGTTSLDGGALSLTLSIVDDHEAQWLVFDYKATSGNLASNATLLWQILQDGLVLATPCYATGAFVLFFTDETVLAPTSSIFGGYDVRSNPVPGGAGIGQGIGPIQVGATAFTPFPAGPLPPLGTFVAPWFHLDDCGIDHTVVNRFRQHIKFQPPKGPRFRLTAVDFLDGPYQPEFNRISGS